jgi:hypothetical protein
MSYLTVKDLEKIFQKGERTILRWVREQREIRFDGQKFIPEKDPSGHWRFIVRRAG